MSRLPLPARAIVLSLLTLLPAGCSRGGPELVKVTGRVQYADGRPVTAASIVFTPDGRVSGDRPAGEGADQLGATSLLAEDGTFSLRSYPHGDGAMVGRYKVTVSLGRGANTKALAEYTRVSTTKLKVDVPPQGLTDLVITLK